MAREAFSYVSPSVLGMFGFEPEEVIGQKLLMLLPPASAEKVTRRLETELAAPVPGQPSRRHLAIELEQKRKDGRLVPTEVVASLLADATGRTTHILGITRDITERQRARETLEQFNAELEQRVTLRTNELSARNGEIEALLDSIPDTVLLCDGNGEVISSHSPQMGAGLTRSADRSAGGDPDPVTREIAREMHARARPGQPTVVQDFDRPLNGSTVSIEARATPCRPAPTGCSSSPARHLRAKTDRTRHESRQPGTRKRQASPT